jgi:enamine deaminase RidA (YjgF/YER057c/UK114 family)
MRRRGNGIVGFRETPAKPGILGRLLPSGERRLVKTRAGRSARPFRPEQNSVPRFGKAVSPARKLKSQSQEMTMPDDIEARIAALGLSLPSPPAPAANYVPFCLAGNLLYIAGQLPRGPSAILYPGRLGAEVSIEQGKEAAQLCSLNILAQVKAALGGFSRVAQCARLNGFVSSTPEFYDHPSVINGASDLMVGLLGERGKHTRIAVGVASLPANAPVEIDAIFLVA